MEQEISDWNRMFKIIGIAGLQNHNMVINQMYEQTAQTNTQEPFKGSIPIIFPNEKKDWKKIGVIINSIHRVPKWQNIVVIIHLVLQLQIWNEIGHHKEQERYHYFIS